MHEECSGTRAHYDRFLADHYIWMAGGFDDNVEKNRRFFTAHAIAPGAFGNAIDLGAGCGFVSIPLAEAGFHVTALDFSQPMLDELRRQDPAHRIETITGDLMDFSLWKGKKPGLITCLGDTLTHLSDHEAVSALIRQCYTELEPGGMLVLSCRDYTNEPEGTVTVIPVQRDEERVFLCRLAYGRDHVRVTDILFSHTNGTWGRMADTYRKLKVSLRQIREWLGHAGFHIDSHEDGNGLMTVIAVKA